MKMEIITLLVSLPAMLFLVAAILFLSFGLDQLRRRVARIEEEMRQPWSTIGPPRQWGKDA